MNHVAPTDNCANWSVGLPTLNSRARAQVERRNALFELAPVVMRRQ